MNSLDKQIEAVVSILRANGGVVGIDPKAPDFVKMAFLEMLLECPDCRETILGEHDGCAN